MNGMRVRSATAALVFLAFGATAATADLCTSAKLKAIGKKELGLLRCLSKVAAKNDASRLVDCEGKVSIKFSAAFAKAGACIGDKGSCDNTARACETAVAVAMTDVFPSACEASKRKAAGKLAVGELGCYASAAATGSPLDATCIARATARFAAIVTRAGTCPDGGSPQTLIEDGCVKPAVTTDGGGTVIDVCPMMPTTTTTNTASSTSTSTSTTTTSTSSSTTSSISGSTTTTSTSSSTTSSTSSSSSSTTSSSTSSTTSSSSTSSTSATTSTTSTTLGCPFLTEWGSPGTGDGQFNLPRGLALDGSDNVYVTDEFNYRLQKFDSTGTFLTKWGSVGTGNGQFDLPRGVAVDGGGNVYVADSGNGRIQVFNGTGGFVAKWGSPGSGNGQFANPSGVIVDGGGSVYVADSGNDRIQKFTSGGTFVAKWGSSGSGDGQFANPIGLAVDGGGNVYVADSGNARIQKFTSSGTFVAKWGSSGSGDGQFATPTGLAVDRDGNVYVADSGNDRIQRFTSSGAFVTNWGTPGSGDGQFATPTGVAVDGSGIVFVADTINTRIQRFACPALSPTTTTTTSTSTSSSTSTSTSTSSTTSTSTTTSSSTSTSSTTNPGATSTTTSTATSTSSTSTTTTTSTSTSTTTTTLQSGCFQDAGDGTIRDNCTGLQWEKKDTAVGSGVNVADLHDVDNRYSWAGLCTLNTTVRCQPNAAAATRCTAQTGGVVGCGECGGADGTCNVDPFTLGAITTVWDWINAVNAANFAGHNDWRLPSEDGRNTSPSTDPRELETILPAQNPCGTSPCISAIFGPTAASYYWSASTFAPLPGYAFAVNFLNGSVNGDGKFFDDYVRAVRTGP